MTNTTLFEGGCSFSFGRGALLALVLQSLTGSLKSLRNLLQLRDEKGLYNS